MNTPSITPINDLVLIKYEPFDPFETTESGIILAKTQKTTVQKRPTEGVVEAIGPKVKSVKPGDKVLFENIRGQDIDETHLILTEDTILGIIE